MHHIHGSLKWEVLKITYMNWCKESLQNLTPLENYSFVMVVDLYRICTE